MVFNYLIYFEANGILFVLVLHEHVVEDGGGIFFDLIGYPNLDLHLLLFQLQKLRFRLQFFC